MPTAGAASDLWTDLAPAWRAGFELAWESFQIGSPPVGAVVADASGRVIAGGRSRRAETAAPPNQLAGSRLAHAEVNALAQLTPDQHEGMVLYTTLQPCLLCSAAVSIAHVGTLRYAGGDPMWHFVRDLPAGHLALEERWYVTEGPMPGPLGAWATLLPVVERIRRRPGGRRLDELRRARPALVELATAVVEDGTADRLVRLSLDEAIDALWDRLPPGG